MYELPNYAVITARRFIYPDKQSEPERFIFIDGKYYPLATVLRQPAIPKCNLETVEILTRIE